MRSQEHDGVVVEMVEDSRGQGFAKPCTREREEGGGVVRLGLSGAAPQPSPPLYIGVGAAFVPPPSPRAGRPRGNLPPKAAPRVLGPFSHVWPHGPWGAGAASPCGLMHAPWSMWAIRACGSHCGSPLNLLEYSDTLPEFFSNFSGTLETTFLI